MKVRPDPFERRLDKLSRMSKISRIGVRMKSGWPFEVGAVQQSESNARESAPLLILAIIPKQNKSARVSMIKIRWTSA